MAAGGEAGPQLRSGAASLSCSPGSSSWDFITEADQLPKAPGTQAGCGPGKEGAAGPGFGVGGV